MSTMVENGEITEEGDLPEDAFSYSEHDAKKALGSSQLTVHIYRAVLDADRPLTGDEIYEAVKGHLNYTDTAIWWRRRKPPPEGGSAEVFDLREAGLARVKDRVWRMATYEVLVSDQPKGHGSGRGNRARYTAGRPPKGFRYRRPPYGWYDLDVRGQDAKTIRHIARLTFLQQARTELKRNRPTAKALRELVAEAIRLLETPD